MTFMGGGIMLLVNMSSWSSWLVVVVFTDVLVFELLLLFVFKLSGIADEDDDEAVVVVEPSMRKRLVTDDDGFVDDVADGDVGPGLSDIV